MLTITATQAHKIAKDFETRNERIENTWSAINHQINQAAQEGKFSVRIQMQDPDNFEFTQDMKSTLEKAQFQIFEWEMALNEVDEDEADDIAEWIIEIGWEEPNERPIKNKYKPNKK